MARTPARKAIGYFATRAEATAALVDWNRNPYDVTAAGITFAKAYAGWAEENKEANKNTLGNYALAFKHSAPLYSLPYKEIKAYQFRRAISECENENVRPRMLALFKRLDRYAMERGIISTSQAELIDVAYPSKESTKHYPFTAEEVARLKSCNEPNKDSVLFLLYTGMRVGEMLALRVKDVDMASNSLIGGSKTAAGINRTIPIHPALKTAILRRTEASAGDEEAFLFGRWTMSTYAKEFKKIMATINAPHTTHDCRHTVASELDRAGANRVCIDRILGHKSQNVGERVYTHKTLDELMETILLLPY